MHNERFFDQTLAMIGDGQLPAALPMLAGKLFNAHSDATRWAETRTALRQHPLHALLLQDPFTARCVSKPRGYAGDAGLIDIIYDEAAPDYPSAIGHDIFNITVKFQAPEGVRRRRRYAETVVRQAWLGGKRICVLACGHFREADALIGSDLSNITLVDQDALSLEVVRRNHADRVSIVEANVFSFLRNAASSGARFDLIYTLGLTDYLDARAMRLLHRLVKACLAPNGTVLLANFVPDHLGIGWMDAVMDWQLIYRDEAELEGYAREVGLQPRTWRDATDSIAWCEMTAEAD
jgi:extracellular factor (EF) 3-hydroxypalmitic acid methyl ester biosynthesis protein